MSLRCPFPWFGGKRRVADVVWSALGDVRNYVEPFAGSLAVLLERPAPWIGPETVNDRDCYLANFWRALKAFIVHRDGCDACTDYRDGHGPLPPCWVSPGPPAGRRP